jgi:hypothetical protein
MLNSCAVGDTNLTSKWLLPLNMGYKQFYRHKATFSLWGIWYSGTRNMCCWMWLPSPTSPSLPYHKWQEEGLIWVVQPMKGLAELGRHLWDYPTLVFFCCCCCCYWVWTQGLSFPRQALYHLSHSTSPNTCVLFLNLPSQGSSNYQCKAPAGEGVAEALTSPLCFSANGRC